MISKVSKENSVLNRIVSAICEKKVQLSVEFDFFGKYQSWSDGIDFFNTTFEFNRKGDHTPRINLFIGLFNMKIIELGIYNVFHDEDEDEEEFNDTYIPEKLEPRDG